ncbi:hypothetical protein ACVWY5_004396 [Bradyrhizobium sp. USDA 3256]
MRREFFVREHCAPCAPSPREDGARDARQLLLPRHHLLRHPSALHLCIDGSAFDQVTTMSKLLCMGMPLPDVIAASTVNAAMALRRPELGSLKPGGVGDATLISVRQGDVRLCRCGRRTSDGRSQDRIRRRRDRRTLVASEIGHVLTKPRPLRSQAGDSEAGLDAKGRRATSSLAKLQLGRGLVRPPRERPISWRSLSAMQAPCWCTRTTERARANYSG